MSPKSTKLQLMSRFCVSRTPLSKFLLPRVQRLGLLRIGLEWRQKEVLTQGYSSNKVVLRWVSWTGNWLGALADDSVVHEILAGCAARSVGIKL